MTRSRFLTTAYNPPLQENRRLSADQRRPFPGRTLLETARLPIEELAEIALREGQASSPIYRVHRWFARRLGSQFRALLTALSLSEEETERFWERYDSDFSLNGAVVLDPFVGGGTSLVEASRCGAKVIGYDLDPVAASITRFELSAGRRKRLDTDALLEPFAHLAESAQAFHTTWLPDGRDVPVLHHFWVETTTCHHCGSEFGLHPHHRLAYDSAKDVQWAFCRECHEVHALPNSQQTLHCGCGAVTQVADGPLKRKIQCPSCAATWDLARRGRVERVPPRWTLFAQEYLDGTGSRPARHFKRVELGDLQHYDAASDAFNALSPAQQARVPERALPTIGRADERPLIHGFTHYRQLFNARQLWHLASLADVIAQLPDDERRFYATAFTEHLTTNCMYAGYAFGYRRLSPLFAMHAYRHITRPVELNPWLRGIGRGTFPNTVQKLVRAVEFAKHPTSYTREGRGHPTRAIGPLLGGVSEAAEDVISGRAEAAVVAQSSALLEGLGDGTVDLILSDPPYFDNLSYSELSDFYLAWQQTVGVAIPPYDNVATHAPIQENLAVTTRGTEAINTYRTRLTSIFRACRRVLRKDGLFVFTYHHRAPEAWAALGTALIQSGFTCTATVPMRGEGQNGLHSFEGTLKWDAVLVCRPLAVIPDRQDDISIIVSLEDIARCNVQAEAYRQRLQQHPRIGFQDHDVLNLTRAFLIAAARVGPLDSQHVTLMESLCSMALKERVSDDRSKPNKIKQEHARADIQI